MIPNISVGTDCWLRFVYLNQKIYVSKTERMTMRNTLEKKNVTTEL